MTDDLTYGFKAICEPTPNGNWNITVTRGEEKADDLRRKFGHRFKFKDIAFTEAKARKSAASMLTKIRKHVAEYEPRTQFEVL